ncbi:MAG: hypothetical protein K0S23_3203 [Fluviicola sp.]|jgi:hypothetical protein|uniref:hypothetical protein n=1 Tax=Fluviicola sp. TaxID=1917219 RepID=UPI00262104FD|nr:hypothetical protein [Fluviicola sp.]MDF3028896.1 hypothetical protein [Fluviicola sp.]
MKTVFIISLVILHLSKPFINEVTQSFGHKSYYISIMIKLPRDKVPKKYIVQNDNLFGHLIKQLKLDSMEDYLSFIRKKLYRNKPLKLNQVGDDFREVIQSKELVDNIKKGKEHFIQTYFDDRGVLKSNMNYDDEAAIIDQLFQWEIPCLNDDESGVLYIRSNY